MLCYACTKRGNLPNLTCFSFNMASQVSVRLLWTTFIQHNFIILFWYIGILDLQLGQQINNCNLFSKKIVLCSGYLQCFIFKKKIFLEGIFQTYLFWIFPKLFLPNIFSTVNFCLTYILIISTFLYYCTVLCCVVLGKLLPLLPERILVGNKDCGNNWWKCIVLNETSSNFQNEMPF